MIRRFFIIPATVLRAPLVGDRYNPSGNQLRDWDNAATVWSGKGWLAPKGSQTEDDTNRDQSTSASWFFTPIDCPAAYYDRMIINGQAYMIVGDPITAYRPNGLHHLEIKVEAIVG